MIPYDNNHREEKGSLLTNLRITNSWTQPIEPLKLMTIMGKHRLKMKEKSIHFNSQYKQNKIFKKKNIKRSKN